MYIIGRNRCTLCHIQGNVFSAAPLSCCPLCCFDFEKPKYTHQCWYLHKALAFIAPSHLPWCTLNCFNRNARYLRQTALPKYLGLCTCTIQSYNSKGSGPNFMDLPTAEFCAYGHYSLLTEQASRFCVTCVSGECLVTWSTHTHKFILVVNTHITQ